MERRRALLPGLSRSAGVLKRSRSLRSLSEPSLLTLIIAKIRYCQDPLFFPVSRCYSSMITLPEDRSPLLLRNRWSFRRAGAMGACILAFSGAAAGGMPALADSPPDFGTGSGAQSLPDGAYGGVRPLERFEFATAVARLLSEVTAQLALTPAETGLSPLQLERELETRVSLERFRQQLQGLLSQIEARSQLPLHQEFADLMETLNRDRDDLAMYGVDADVLHRQAIKTDRRLSRLPPIRFFGTGTFAWKTSEQYFGGNRGQLFSGVDADGALLDTNPAPGAAAAVNAGKRGFFTNPAVLYDTQVGIQYSPSRAYRAVAEFILGNYWGAWKEQQAFSNAFGAGADGMPLLSNRQPGSFALQPLTAYISGSASPPLVGNYVKDASGTLGRFPTKLTRYTWWAVDPDTYINVPREDSGNIYLTGGAFSGKLGGLSLSVFGGYEPTDGTAPWQLTSSQDPTRNGLIGFGHPVRPGGSLFTPGGTGNPFLAGATQGLTPGTTVRDHFQGDYTIPSISSMVAARLSLPAVGFNYVLGTGDDWRTGAAPAFGGSAFRRTGETYSVDFNTTVPVHRIVPSAPHIGIQGEVAVTKQNNWGAYGISNAAAAVGPSNIGNATDYKLTFPIGSVNMYWGGKSISGGYNAPGYWGQLGSWVNPWNFVTDSPVYVKTGRGLNHWQVPLIPTEFGMGLPFTNVPIVGDLAFSLQAGVGHLQDSTVPTQIGPNQLAAAVPSANLFRISHAETGLSFGAGKNSGYKLGLSAESVLRDYPEGGSFKRDVTLLWDALKNLVNIKGGSGAHQLAPQLGLIPGAPPFMTDENYYRFTVGKNLTQDGNTSAKLTLERVVYNDSIAARSGLAGSQTGGGSYRGAVGTLQVNWKF